MPNLITFTLDPQYAGSGFNPGPFTIYGIDQSSNVVVIASGVPKSTLIAGVTYTVQDGITHGTIVSTGTCTNQISWSVNIATPPIDPVSNYGKTFTITSEMGTISDTQVRYMDMNGNVVQILIGNIPTYTIDPVNTKMYTWSICVKQGGLYSTPECIQGSTVVVCSPQWIQVGICQ